MSAVSGDPDLTDRTPFRATVPGAGYDRVASLPVTIVLDNVRSLYNVGAFFRTADNVRADELVLCGITARPPHPRLSKTALGAEHCVRWRWVPEAATAVEELRARGLEVATLETCASAIDLFVWQPRFPVAIVFGHEVDGVSATVRDRCDVLVRIPTLGRKQSLNVATAGGVVCYELLRRYLERFGASPVGVPAL